MTVMIGIAALAVDYGQVSLVKTELQGAADAAALNGLTGLQGGTAVTAAQAAALENTASGAAVSVPSSDVQVGNWAPSTKVFTVNGSPSNAVRVTTRRTAATNNAVRSMFGGIFGAASKDVTAMTVASNTASADVTFNVGALASPWVAGMPNGTYAQCSAPTNSPFLVSGLTLRDGDKLQFFNLSGNIFVPGWGNFPVEGRTDVPVTNAARNGIGGMSGPCHAVIGVFLNDSAPNTMSAPASLDYLPWANRNQTSYSPQLK